MAVKFVLCEQQNPQIMHSWAQDRTFLARPMFPPSIHSNQIILVGYHLIHMKHCPCSMSAFGSIFHINSYLNTLQFYNNLYVYSLAINIYYSNVNVIIMASCSIHLYKTNDNVVSPLSQLKRFYFIKTKLTSSLFLNWWHASLPFL